MKRNFSLTRRYSKHSAFVIFSPWPATTYYFHLSFVVKVKATAIIAAATATYNDGSDNIKP